MVDLANPFFKDFDKLFIGWDDTYNKLTKLHDDVTKNIPNYPPYNIKQVEDNHYYSNQFPKENHYLCGHFNVQVDGTTSTFYNLNGHINEMKNTFISFVTSVWIKICFDSINC